MLIAERVNRHITELHPEGSCDGCIAVALGLRHQQANRVTMALATTSDFERDIDICFECGKELKVIRRTQRTKGPEAPR